MPGTESTRWAELSAEDCLNRLESSPHGLSPDEAGARLERHGPNSVGGAEGVSPWLIFLHQFASPLIYVLLAAMVVTLAIQHWADAIVIAMVLTINATIGFFQEYRAENAMQALQDMVSPKATVRRGGQRVEIPSEQLVPGDIILLESGDLVPADVRIIEETNLQIDEAMLTGESVPVGKTAEASSAKSADDADARRNMAFMGTSVTSGRARGVVTATGAATQIGEIAGEMRTTRRAHTPLQNRMHRFAQVVTMAILGASALAFAIGLVRGMAVSDMFLTAVAIAVAAIPEGLPVVMTVALAVCVRRMAKRNAIIRRLPAVETLGSCTVIASDKTGTLTQNQMTVRAAWAGGERFDITGEGLSLRGGVEKNGDAIDVEAGSPLSTTLLAGMLANESDLRKHPDAKSGDDEEMAAYGDPTEVALLVAAAKAGLSREDLLDQHPQIDQIPFESERQFSATIHRKKGGDGEIVFLKGAPERVLEMCDRAIGADGDTELDRERILEEGSRLAAEGLRLLAMATGEGDAAESWWHGSPSREKNGSENGSESRGHPSPKGLTFLGLVGMLDPPRPEAIEAVKNCHEAGIRVIMVTGDHATTAGAIARMIGIVEKDDAEPETRTGAQVEAMSDEELRETLNRVNVFARVSPQQKHRIVLALRELGEIVAVTGDGVNDAPALKSAHIGAAMGKSGTDVAKEASEMVLTDDNFATIYSAVAEGRTAFSNIRMATHFLISSGVGVMLAILAALVGGLPIPFLPAQILWINVVTNGIQDVALAFEPGEREQRKRPPRPPEEGIISPRLWERTIVVGIVLGAVALGVFIWELSLTEDVAYAQVAALTAIVLFKAVHVGSCRSETRSVFRKSPFSNPVLFVGTSVSVLIHIGAMYFPPTQFLLNLQPLTLETWGRLIMFAPAGLLLEEAHKAVRSRVSRGGARR